MYGEGPWTSATGGTRGADGGEGPWNGGGGGAPWHGGDGGPWHGGDGAPWRGSWRSEARYYEDGWRDDCSPSGTVWRPAHYQHHQPHTRSATDPNLSAGSRPPPPRRRLPPTPKQPSNLNIDQVPPLMMNRSPTVPGQLSTTELAINFPKLNPSPSHKPLGDFRLPPGMIPSKLPRVGSSAMGRRTLPTPIPGWSGLEEAVAAGRGSRQLPTLKVPSTGVVGKSPTRARTHSEEEEEDWC